MRRAGVQLKDDVEHVLILVHPFKELLTNPAAVDVVVKPWMYLGALWALLDGKGG